MEKAGIQESNDDFTRLEKLIKKCMEESKVIKTKIMNEPQKEWINKSIITEINERNLMWTELQNNPEREDLKEKFITKRHKIIKLIRETKKSYYKKEFDKYSGKPKKLWNLLNTLTNNKFKQRCAPPKLIVNSIEITDPHEICNIFNNFFATIGPYLADEIPIQFHAKAKERSEAARVRKETTFAQALRSNKEFPQLGASRTSITTDEELGPTPPSPPRQTALTASTDHPNLEILLAILQRMDSVVAEVNNMRTEMNSLKTELLIIKRAKQLQNINTHACQKECADNAIKSNRVCGQCKCIREFVTISQLDLTSDEHYRCINCGSDQCARINPKTALNSINKVKKTKRGKCGGCGIFHSAVAASGVSAKSNAAVPSTAPARAEGGARHVCAVAVAVPQLCTPRMLTQTYRAIAHIRKLQANVTPSVPLHNKFSPLDGIENDTPVAVK
ncbi:unnamed protein product [Parnassius apollo]|uniref:(apollo) hypothetical protein n=1 Tax=Parnassius apollo TaxID=110799 RepID=A0A8S3W7V5_PARAO|nr:unnamed protein product [Parnassius apollo]